MAVVTGIRLYDILLRVSGELEGPEGNVAGNLANILDFITTRTRTTLGHPRVYDRARLFTSETDLRAAFLDTTNNRLHFWTVRRANSVEEHQVNHAVRRTHTIQLTGRVAVNDANDTEGLVQQETETVCDALRPFVDLEDNCELFRITSAAITDVEYAGMGVHQALITCTAREYLQFTPA